MASHRTQAGGLPRPADPIPFVALAALPLLLLPFAVIALQNPARPFTDDGFYALSVARHIALGEGITVDGTTWTNGFQPLWVFLTVPAAWIARGDRLWFLRLALGLSAVLWVGAALAIGTLAARLAGPERARAARAWAAVMYLTCPAILRLHVNGLETGLLLLLFALIGCIFADASPWTPRRTAALSLLAGALVLCRIDTLLFVPLFAAAAARATRDQGWRASARVSASIAVSAAIVSSPWWIYNWSAFGSLLPSSGAAVFDWQWRPVRALALLMAAASNALPLPIRPFWPWHYDWCAAPLLLALGIGSAGAIRARLRRLDRAFLFIAAVSSYALVLVVAYAFSPAWWMYDRYTSPITIAAVPVLASALARTWPVVRPRMLAAAGGAALALEILFVVLAVRAPSNTYYQAQLALVARHVPPSDRVGAFQSGTLGYFRDGVVNLDGKVNPAALAARRHLETYTETIGLKWIADFPVLVEQGFGTMTDWRLVEQVNQPGCPSCAFALYTRRAAPAPLR